MHVPVPGEVPHCPRVRVDRICVQRGLVVRLDMVLPRAAAADVAADDAHPEIVTAAAAVLTGDDGTTIAICAAAGATLRNMWPRCFR